jgi:hypothetical protein
LKVKISLLSSKSSCKMFKKTDHWKNIQCTSFEKKIVHFSAVSSFIAI